MEIAGKKVEVSGRIVRVCRLAAEGFEFVPQPERLASELCRARVRADLFTFVQKLPVTSPVYHFPKEWDNVAAMSISTFEHWWTRQISAKTRNMVRRAEKKGLVCREVPFDDALVKGIWNIYNECPVRQGRPFPHYGKDCEAVREMSATFLEASIFIGAFYRDKLVGFVKLTVDDDKSQAAIMHIISLAAHRDMAPMNALIAESVRACARRAIPFLVYSKFSYGKKGRDGLSDFKARNGFQCINVPRYFVPVTRFGAVAFRLGLHRGILEYLPGSATSLLRRLRDHYYARVDGIGRYGAKMLLASDVCVRNFHL